MLATPTEEAVCQLNSLELVELAKLLQDKWHPFTGRALELKTKSGMSWTYFGKHLPGKYRNRQPARTAEAHSALAWAGDLVLRYRLEHGCSLGKACSALKEQLDYIVLRFPDMYYNRSEKS